MGTVTIGADTFDIYGTEAGAATYFRARLGASAWNSAGSSDKKRGLVSATRWIDSARWQGAPTASGQALAFPRTGLLDCDGVAVDDSTVPAEVDQACYELALKLLEDPTLVDNVNSGSDEKRLKAGSAEIEFFRNASSSLPGGGASLFPAAAARLLRCFIAGASGIRGSFNSGVDDAESLLDPCDRFSLDEGFA